MQLASLGSGSRGNATLVRAGGTCVLVDCGFSVREVEKRAARLGVSVAAIDAILVTHEHGDHSSGVAGLSRRYEIPVYLTHGTLSSGRIDGCFVTRTFDADSELRIGELTAQAVAVAHDSREPVQYQFSAGEQRIGVLTDLGSVTRHVCQAFQDCDLLLLEFNHDSKMLADGPYPQALKRRVGGDWGHLSNGQALELLRSLNYDRLRYLVIAHISDKNNSRACIEAQLADGLPSMLPRLVWATQDAGFAWLDTTDRGDEPRDTMAEKSVLPRMASL